MVRPLGWILFVAGAVVAAAGILFLVTDRGKTTSGLLALSSGCALALLGFLIIGVRGGFPATDPELARLAQLSQRLAGGKGRLLHDLHVDYMRRARGVWFQQGQGAEPRDDEPDAEPIPPRPEGDEEDPLEEAFGGDADRLRLITPDELKELRDGDQPPGSEPDPDLSGRGWIGEYPPDIDLTALVDVDRTRRYGGRLPGCGRVWILELTYLDWPVPSCPIDDYSRLYRTSLLRALFEASRACRARYAHCPNGRTWLLSAEWGCYEEAQMSFGSMVLVLAVACVGD